MNTKVRMVINIIKWIFCVFFIIGGLASISKSIEYGLFTILFGISLCPLLWNLLSKAKINVKIPFKVVIPIALFIFMMVTVPPLDKAVKVDNQTAKQVSQTSTEASQTDSTQTDMKVSFIDVGQADSILIQSSSHYMLMDAGNNEDSNTIVSYLKSQGVTKLDYVIGSHPHEDHIGSMDTVINTFDIGTVIMPDVTSTTQTIKDVLTATSNKGLNITRPVVGTKYDLGNASFVIVAPNSTYGAEYNNWSVGIKLTNGSNSFVMCGDAEI